MRREKPGEGSVSSGRGGTLSRRIIVAFDEDTFDELRSRATAEGVSFASVVRDVVEWGLMEVRHDA